MNTTEKFQHELFNLHRDGFLIKSPLLRACIGGETYINLGNHNVLPFKGFQYSKVSIGYIVLCALLSEALGVRRLLYKTDRVVSEKTSRFKSELDKLDGFIQQEWE